MNIKTVTIENPNADAIRKSRKVEEGRAARHAKRAAENARRQHRKNQFEVLLCCVVVVFATTVVTLSLPRSSTPLPEVEPTTPHPSIQVVEVVETNTAVAPKAWNISDSDIELVAQVVSAMARGEDYLTQQAVAQCIRTVCEEGGLSVPEAVTRLKYPVDAGEISQSCIDATQSIVDGCYAVDADIKYSYNPFVQGGEWHERQNFVCQLGSLRFFN